MQVNSNDDTYIFTLFMLQTLTKHNQIVQTGSEKTTWQKQLAHNTKI